MKNLVILVVFVANAVSAIAQNTEHIANSLKSITNLTQIEPLKLMYPDWLVETIEVSDDDTTLVKNLIPLDNERISFIRSGQKEFIIKPIVSDEIEEFRVSYIYLDGKKLTSSQIDSIRNLIIDQFSKGVSFVDLARNYSMDGNSQKGGDLGWFESGNMISEFEKSIKESNQGDIFTVDIPANNWYYVVLKTFSERKRKKYSLIKVTRR